LVANRIVGRTVFVLDRVGIRRCAISVTSSNVAAKTLVRAVVVALVRAVVAALVRAVVVAFVRAVVVAFVRVAVLIAAVGVPVLVEGHLDIPTVLVTSNS
jgi:hypothetical protein